MPQSVMEQLLGGFSPPKCLRLSPLPKGIPFSHSSRGAHLGAASNNIPQVKVVATGSSSLDLANRISEPLTGRKRQFTLFPFSFSEMVEHHSLLSETNLLTHRLIYGYYPDIVNSPGEERLLLQELSDSYLYKDILTFDKIKKSERLTHLLRALAFKIGSQVSYTELGQLCGLDNKTVDRYISILEQAFVIFNPSAKSKRPKVFQTAYPESSFTVINKDNFTDFLL